MREVMDRCPRVEREGDISSTLQARPRQGLASTVLCCVMVLRRFIFSFVK